MSALIQSGALAGGDGTHHPQQAPTDRLSAPGHDIDYRLTDDGAALIQELGIDLDALGSRRRPLIRYCLDWTEQRHHLAGGLGAAIAARLFELDWARRARQHRAVTLTEEGAHALKELIGMSLDAGRRAETVVS